MMKRTAYALFEKTILDLYNRNILTLHQLDYIADQYRLTAIDSAGSRFLVTRDGKDLHQVCIGLVDPCFPLASRGSRDDDDEAWERELRKWEEIVYRRWGWRAYCNPFPHRQREEKTCA